MKPTFSSALLAALALLPARALAGSGTILLPQPGTQIAPGASFNFSYDIRADYCTSTYAFSVYLLTTPSPSSSSSSSSSSPSASAGTGTEDDEAVFAAGHFFGRYDAENYPAVPRATNPAPAALVMPDFAAAQAGWGAGQRASDQTWRLAVVEEWDGCDTTVSAAAARGW